MVSADKEYLTGGYLTQEVIRDGNVVRRTSGSHSVFLSAVLKILEEAAYPYAPRYLGRDDAGHDVLEYIPGSISQRGSCEGRSERSYEVAARMLRELHDITSRSALAAEAECIVHDDVGPFNTIFVDKMPVAFIDWDCARPGNRSSDLGLLAAHWCILTSSEPDLHLEAQRMASVLKGYDMFDPEELLQAAVTVMRANAEYSWYRTKLAEDNDSFTAAVDAYSWAERCVEHLRANYRFFIDQMNRL